MKNGCLSAAINAATLHGRFRCRGWRVPSEDDMARACAVAHLWLVQSGVHVEDVVLLLLVRVFEIMF
jgi:hypothetical protein